MNKVLSFLLNQGINKGVFPGAVAGVCTGIGRQKRKFFAHAGICDIRFPEEPVVESTNFDLASLTKALSTTLIIYSLVQERKIRLLDTLQSFFPDQIDRDRDKQGITIEQLLSHSSGLRGYYPFFKDIGPQKQKSMLKKKLLQFILSDKLEYESGSDCVYSDFGFVILGAIIEKVTGYGLDTNFENYVTRETDLSQKIFFNTLPAIREVSTFAATENCPWRGRIMRSEVHDEHCWLMGGVAGHAGLFGEIEGVLDLCGHILDQWQSEGNTYAWSHMLKKGLVRRYKNQTWCLGFDTPSAVGSSGGKYLSPFSVGHLGYTGTSLWIDPEKELVMVLLTNRVHPSRDNIQIKKFRPYFHTEIIRNIRQ